MKKILFTTLLTLISFTGKAQFSGLGIGTNNDPYQITNADELFEVRNDLAAHYKVMNEIDLTQWIDENNPTQGWSPIGNSSTPFTGSFDGSNYTIKGLYINRSTDNIGFFGYVSSATIKNITLQDPTISGGSNTGAIIGTATSSATISGNVIINSNVLGTGNTGGLIGVTIGHSTISDNIVINGCTTGSKTGGIVGACEFLNDNHAFVSNSIVLKGNIKGTEITGGIVGSFTTSYKKSTTIEYNYVYNNLCSANITSSGNYCGGIVGYCSGARYYNAINRNEYFYYISIKDNAFYGRINGNVCGGIVGNATYTKLYNNICGGDIFGNDVYGISPSCKEINSCVFSGDTLYSTSTNIYRISPSASTTNNYANSLAKIYANGKQTTVDDSYEQGTGYGLKLLKKQSTYEGLGFNFEKTWAIAEGETFPYMISQGEPAKVTSFQAGSKGSISGKANGTGKVYVIRENIIYEAPIIGDSWSVQFGNVTEGEVVDVYSHYNNKLQSITVKATASLEPIVSTGDANGDGAIDTTDVVAIINKILGKESSSFIESNADVNGDGEVMIDDAVLTVQMILDAQ